MANRVLRVLLLNSNVDVRQALRPDVAHDVIPVRTDLPFGGSVAVARRLPTVPGWVNYVGEAVPRALTDISNRSSGAVVFVEVDGRILAFTFGRGRNLLDPAQLEDDFGLRVTLNAVDAGKVRAIDSRSFEDTVLHTSRQASRDLELGSFAIDDSRDVLAAVTGVPRDPTLGARISGSDAVALSTDTPVADLGGLAHRLLELKDATAYRDSFAFIDYVRQVRTDDLLVRLDALLDIALAGTLEGLSLAPPERVDYEDVSGYRYSGERRGRDLVHPDIDLAEYLVAMGGTTTVADLKHDSIRLIAASTDETARQWSAYRCTAFETHLGNSSYVLSNGKWFAVDLDFVADVEARLNRIPIVDLGLPDALKDEAEGDYNARAVAQLGDAALLDKVPFKPRGARSTIEIADIALGTRLLHVKRKTSSSTLSHLFAQGRTAGESLKQDPTVRVAVRDKLAATGHPMTALLSADRLSPRSIGITYVIVASNPGALPGALPFFSKLNLVRSREFLEEALDFSVSAAWVRQPA